MSVTLDNIKSLIKVNNIFETSDDNSGTLLVPTEKFNNCEYGYSAFFEEGGSPGLIVSTKTVAWDTATFRLVGDTEEKISKAYLGAFYSWLLLKLEVNQTNILEENIISNSSDMDNLFLGLSTAYSSDSCLLTSHSDFTSLLSIPYSSPDLRICFKGGGRFYNNDSLSWGEPLVLIPGHPKNKLITAERASVTLNLPQSLESLGKNEYRVEMQFKIIFHEDVKVFQVNSGQ